LIPYPKHSIITLMLGRTHDLFAFTTITLAAIYLPVPNLSIATALVAILSAMIGSLLPDIDQKSSDIWDTIPLGEILGKIVSPFIGKHRHITHSLLGVIIVYFISNFTINLIRPYLLVNLNIVWQSFMLGYLSHLFADSLTEAGIPIFFPFKYKFGIPPIKKLRIKTGKWFENYIIFPGLILINIYLFWQNFPQILKLFK